jgi:hypothetical protein
MESPERLKADGFSWKDARIRASTPATVIGSSAAIDDDSDVDAIVDSWRREPHASKVRVEAILRVAEGDTGGPPMKHERK